MITVPEAARRLRRNPETVRRWIREGKLPSRKVGTQHVIEEADIEGLLETAEVVALPSSWKRTWTGEPMPDWLSAVRRDRAEH
jgi:excisionase family DNA binding protein